MRWREAIVLTLVALGTCACGRPSTGSPRDGAPASSAVPATSAREPQAVALADALGQRDHGQAVFVDVRSREAYAQGHIPGALSVPLGEVEARSEEIRSLHKLPILYCG